MMGKHFGGVKPSSLSRLANWVVSVFGCRDGGEEKGRMVRDKARMFKGR